MEGEQAPQALRGYDSFEVRLGDELRGERATLGKSLLDVQRELRIKATYIAAIENCDPDVFPNKGFIAGYVRSYARYLELDPVEVFRRFSEESGFDGVNADLVRKPRSGGTKTLSGPIRIDRNDPLFRPVAARGAVTGGWLSDLSLSALGSVLVLIILIVGLVAGGMQVLRDIQRVEIEPVNQRPTPLAQVTEIVAPGLGTDRVLLDSAPEAPDDADLARLYQPRELALPVVETRDGPIVEIDPDQARPPEPPQPVAGHVADALKASAVDPIPDPQVREDTRAPAITVLARQPAWIRVYLGDGTVLFEKIIETGEVYTLPQAVEAPLLRAGNAGSVFVGVDRALYGPIGQGTGVAKQISLLPDDVLERFGRLDEVPEVMEAALSASLPDRPEE
ncbi:MAG: RodZ domain-containing protein [Pseudomonadota bacterium]